MSFLEKDYREIITKAVCGKGKKFTEATHTISPSHKPTSILGCWVINHLYNAKKKSKDTVEVNGSYDINIWYSYNDNNKTEVVTERVTYRDEVPLAVKDEHSLNDDYDVICKVLEQPNCLECNISKKGHKINVEVDCEFLFQIISETIIFVRVDPEGYASIDDEDDWYLKVTDNELSDVNPNILSSRSND